MDKNKIMEGVRLILEGVGEDVTREGLVETPDRIARMYEELAGGYTDDDGALRKLAAFSYSLSGVEKAEILPYHTLGRIKYEKMGLPYPLEGVDPPPKERIENARRIFAEEKARARLAVSAESAAKVAAKDAKDAAESAAENIVENNTGEYGI